MLFESKLATLLETWDYNYNKTYGAKPGFKHKTTGVHCNKCKDGYMEERKGRFGIFYSCSNYPDCKHIIKTRPTGNRCTYVKADGTQCGELMMTGTKTIPERCSDKTCPNHNPHKLEGKK
jgi:ssDNA-binding Zn-finger/Zn-ribbon topoisomerase 1